jgi:hypothetical protein
MLHDIGAYVNTENRQFFRGRESPGLGEHARPGIIDPSFHLHSRQAPWGPPRR